MNQNITRKDFLKKTFSFFAGFYLFNLLNPVKNLLAAKQIILDSKTVLHIKGKNLVKNTISKMVNQGFNQIGGISKFIQPGMKVIIKPNIGFNSPPEQAHNTNPDLVEAVARLCIKAGAKVKIFDRSAYTARLCYRASGIQAAGKRAGAKVEFVSDRKFKEVKVKKGMNLDTLEVYNEMLKADFVINMPIAKDHSAATLTLSMKNLMGCIGGFRGKFHLSLHKNIVDFTKTIPVNLVIMDTTRILTDHGPGSGTLEDVKTPKSIVFATNPVTVDAYTAQTFFNIKPASIDYLKYAYQEKMGEININKIKVKKQYV